jgi:hypothetical protein
MNKKIFFLFALLWAESSLAGLLRIESNTFMANRTGDDLKSETPFYEEFKTSYLNQEKKLKVDFDFGYSYDFSRQVYNLNLNQLNFESDIGKSNGHVSVGRTFESYHLVKSSTVDMLALDYGFFENRIKTGVLIGLLRSYDFDKSSGSAPVYSVYTNFKSLDQFPIKASVKFQYEDYSGFSRAKYQTVKTTLKKEFKNLNTYLNLQKGISFNDSFRNEVGLDYFPFYDWSYSLSASEYQKNKKEGFEQSIFNSFSLGKVQEVSGSIGHTFTPKLYSGMSLAVATYPIQRNQDTTGEKVDWSTNYQISQFAFKTSLYYLKSFGGKAYGYHLNGDYNLNDIWNLILENEWVKYSKITSERNMANLVRLGSGYKFNKNTNIEALGELSNNNFYSKELAFLLRLNFMNWREI